MIKEVVHKFGKFISSMIVPNIGAFIAWGFISAIFMPTGGFPNEKIAILVSALIKCLIPVLVGVTGGKVAGGIRGGIVAGIATMGVIVGSDVPMIIGAMIIGTFAGYITKSFDKIVKDKIPVGFEMIVNNFSIAIIGIILAIIGLFIVGPSMLVIIDIINNGVSFIITKGLLPLIAIFIEPIKVLFLNNFINHGIIDLIAIEQVNRIGKSILYLLEANPGPGLGVILAYWTYSKGAMKETAPSAAIIQSLGGIHEIYFPYILVNPILIVPAILGNMASIIVFLIFNSGLVATASPGSIFSIIMLSNKGDIIGNILGVLVGASISFFMSSILFKRKILKKQDKHTDKNKIMKLDINVNDIKKIVFACDVGMGSSALGAKNFGNRLKGLNLDIEVGNSSVNNIPKDADIVITHKGLIKSIKSSLNKYNFLFIENFLEDEKLEMLYEKLYDISENNKKLIEKDIINMERDSILNEKNIVLGLKSESKEEAIIRAGELLVEMGYVKYEYIDSMLERESKISTYIGMGISIPHGTEQGKNEIENTGVAILQYPDGVSFGGQMAYLIIAVAANGDEHLGIISSIATSLGDLDAIEKMRTTSNINEILRGFSI